MLEIKWLGHASFKIKVQNKVIYLDPWKLKTAEPADLILITHEHHDHYSAEDIDKIKKEETIITAPADLLKKLPGQTRPAKIGETLKINGLEIEPVPAYNTNKEFHPRANNWVGYLIKTGQEIIYHAGDTDLIPEMAEIKCDLALLPVSGTYVMTAEEAAQALTKLKAKKAIPMHWGEIIGSRADAERFKELAPAGVQVEIPEKN